MNLIAQQLITNQLSNWHLAASNYDELSNVRSRIIEIAGINMQVQYNPARIISSSAKVDAQSIAQRPCFLCKNNRPEVQESITIDSKFELLVNPFPIFPRHFTIAAVNHTPQRISSHFGQMLHIAQQLNDYVIFYNGPQCGASAPDHLHFQAGNKGFLPIEKASLEQLKQLPLQCNVLESNNTEELQQSFESIYAEWKAEYPHALEPMMNILCAYYLDGWRVWLFKRRKHRPYQYDAEGAEKLILSPASVDLGGVWITPRLEDYEKITKQLLLDIMQQI